MVVISVLFAWQLYKYRHLKRIHMDELTICDALSMINSYKKWINKEIISGAFLVVPYFFLITWGKIFDIRLFIATMTVTVIIVIPLYRLYIRRIRVVRQSVEELKEFTVEENAN